MEDLYPTEKQIKRAIENSQEIVLINDYFKKRIGKDVPEDVFNYMLELYKDIPFILPKITEFRRKKFAVRKTIDYIIDNFNQS